MKIAPEDLGLESWRPGQYQAIVNSRTSAKRFVGQCAPVGSGKSHMLMAEAVDSGARTLILTANKPLQKQYSDLFRYLNILDVQGKSNYSCRAMELGGEYYDGTPAKSVSEGPCQFGEECGLRLSGCTYYDKVAQAKYRRIVSTNYAARISANLYTEGWGHFDLILADEFHEAEDWLARMLAVRLPRCYSNLTGAKMPNTTNVALWVLWANRELPMVKAAIRIEKKAQATAKRKRFAKLRTLQSLEADLTRMCTMTSEWKVFHNKNDVLFQPIWVHEYAEPLIFGGASKVVCASSTMVSNTMNLMGITDNEMDFFTYPSTFPVDRRPIYYYPVAKMRHGMPEEEKQLCVSVADDFISARMDRKGFIPTTSYAWQETFLKYSRYKHLMVASSPSIVGAMGPTSSANTTLQRFKMSPTPSILIGPNWSTGINLAYKHAEYTIVPKVPFADITDPLHVARSEDHPDYGWYHAGIKLQQIFGRAMRADDDHNETIILDKTFGSYMTRYRRMIADWVWAAVHRVHTLPVPLEPL